MADSSQDKGFTLPAPQSSGNNLRDTGAPTANASASSPATQALQIVKQVLPPAQGPQPRDYALGGGALIVLLVAFFFAKNAYSNYLAGKRVPPGAANAAGWWLFIFLTGLAFASVLVIISPVKFLTPLFMVPLGGISLVALVLMVLSGRRS